MLFEMHILLIFVCIVLGESANAVPHYQKLRTRVTHFGWSQRSAQP